MKPDKLSARQAKEIRDECWWQAHERQKLLRLRRLRGLRRHNIARRMFRCDRCGVVHGRGFPTNIGGFTLCYNCGDGHPALRRCYEQDSLARLIRILTFDLKHMAMGVDSGSWGRRAEGLSEEERDYRARCDERRTYISALQGGFIWDWMDPRSEERRLELERAIIADP